MSSPGEHSPETVQKYIEVSVLSDFLNERAAEIDGLKRDLQQQLDRPIPVADESVIEFAKGAIYGRENYHNAWTAFLMAKSVELYPDQFESTD